MSRIWGRLYAGTRNHRKIKILANRHPNLWAYWYVLLDMAIELDDDGWIYIAPDQPYSFKELAKELRIRREDHVKELCKSLEDLGMIARSDRGIQILSYNERNFDSDSSTVRVRKYRERSKDETFQKRYGNGHETKSVTPQNRIEQSTTENNIVSGNDEPKTEKIALSPEPLEPTAPARSKKSRAKPKPNGYSQDFETFWAKKIHREDDRKADAWREWRKLEKAKELPNIADLLTAVEYYNEKNDDTEKTYIPQTFRYLKNKIFLDIPKPEIHYCYQHPDRRAYVMIDGFWLCPDCRDGPSENYAPADVVQRELAAIFSKFPT